MSEMRPPTPEEMANSAIANRRRCDADVEIDWDGAICRLKAMMREIYPDGEPVTGRRGRER